ncbi:hypothetical protein OsI_04773 [Oryza sativa Indica Group]|uniref:Uncharacterized protein n=1 Tax=Oryza sativa subsp. indica TaxID=39946 RepID=B8A7P5_ORYSI|nr:hypothetical protein OsI_04773 [Oryza sativa Indica Group]
MGKPELACLRSLSSFTSQLPQPVEHSGICKICSHIIQFSHTTKKKRFSSVLQSSSVRKPAD